MFFQDDAGDDVVPVADSETAAASVPFLQVAVVGKPVAVSNPAPKSHDDDEKSAADRNPAPVTQGLATASVSLLRLEEERQPVAAINPVPKKRHPMKKGEFVFPGRRRR